MPSSSYTVAKVGDDLVWKKRSGQGPRWSAVHHLPTALLIASLLLAPALHRDSLACSVLFALVTVLATALFLVTAATVRALDPYRGRIEIRTQLSLLQSEGTARRFRADDFTAVPLEEAKVIVTKWTADRALDARTGWEETDVSVVVNGTCYVADRFFWSTLTRVQDDGRPALEELASSLLQAFDPRGKISRVNLDRTAILVVVGTFMLDISLLFSFGQNIYPSTVAGRLFSDSAFVYALFCHSLTVAILFSVRALLRSWGVHSVSRRLFEACGIEVSLPKLRSFPGNRWLALSVTMALHAAYFFWFARPA